MINDEIGKNRKLKELLKITNISDNEFEKLDYKGKQKYFKAKRKLCNVFFTSIDKNGNGITYKKGKGDNNVKQTKKR